MIRPLPKRQHSRHNLEQNHHDLCPKDVKNFQAHQGVRRAAQKSANPQIEPPML